MRRPRVLLADDHSIILAGIRTLVEAECEVVGEVGDGRSLVDAAMKLRPDLIVLDIGMPLLNGIDAARQIRNESVDMKLLFLTMHASRMYLREAMRAGASGYVLKTSAVEELQLAIRRVLKGGRYISPVLAEYAVEARETPTGRRSSAGSGLTSRQREVLQLLAEGRTNQKIADILHVSIKTVQFHRGQIMRKTGAHSAVKLVSLAIQDGLVSE